jgi:hypothetical protein
MNRLAESGEGMSPDFGRLPTFSSSRLNYHIALFRLVYLIQPQIPSSSYQLESSTSLASLHNI